MTCQLRLLQAGDSVSVTLPNDMVERLRLHAGDSVLAVETECGILLTTVDSSIEGTLEAAAAIAKKYQVALRELAK